MATGDDDNICIWSKSNKDTKKYLNIKKFNLDVKTTDLLLINKEYFITSQQDNGTLSYFNINRLIEEGTIKLNKDISDFDDCLYLIFGYTILICVDGLIVISNNT